MKNILNYLQILTITLFTQGYCFADKKFGNAVEVLNGVKGSNETADSAVQVYLSRALALLYIIAVILIIYGGFLIFTSSGDDEKVSKGKNVIKEALIGIVIIYGANSLVLFLIKGVLTK